jgi:pimeloyl-ACP methyl ester carboxylesterase
VLHGTERNANQYRNAIIVKAESKGFIVIAPEFSEQNFPGGDAYNLGNVFEDGDNPSANTLNPENEWTFSIIEPLFDYVKTQINNNNTQYHVFGHSAGAQFVHRFLMFKPTARVANAVISAAGWYTFPNNVVYPYGQSQSPLENMSISSFLSKKVFVQVGQFDNNPNDAGLRHTVLADAQGLNRKDRAENYYDFCQQLALNSNITFNWAFNSVANADHDYIKASENAANLIFN